MFRCNVSPNLRCYLQVQTATKVKTFRKSRWVKRREQIYMEKETLVLERRTSWLWGEREGDIFVPSTKLLHGSVAFRRSPNNHSKTKNLATSAVWYARSVGTGQAARQTDFGGQRDGFETLRRLRDGRRQSCGRVVMTEEVLRDRDFVKTKENWMIIFCFVSLTISNRGAPNDWVFAVTWWTSWMSGQLNSSSYG